jgi:hypothetical protein
MGGGGGPLGRCLRNSGRTEDVIVSQTSNESPTSWARTVGRRVLRRGKFLLGHDPVFLPIFLRLTPLGTSRRITAETELVVEGFPRSGNTFTVFALLNATGSRLHIASHVHHPSQIKLSVERGVPTVLVVRNPVDCLSSYLAYGQHGRAATVLKEYAGYHRELVPYVDRILVCDFDEITTDLSSIILRINERFSMAIPPFDQSTPNVEQVFEEIARQHQLLHPRLNPDHVAPRPTEARREVSQQARSELLEDRHYQKLADALDLYKYLAFKAAQQRAEYERRQRTEHRRPPARRNTRASVGSQPEPQTTLPTI